MGRLFSDEQLQEMSEPLCDKALRALHARDLVLLESLLKEMSNGPAGLNMLGMPIMTRFFAEFRKDFGEDVADQLLERIGRNLLHTMIEKYRAGNEKQVISDLISVYKYQYGAQVLPGPETPDEVVYELIPCGSGGSIPRSSGADHWSDGMNSYCRYCKATQRAFNKAVGCDAWSAEISPDVPGRCTMRFRKTATKGRELFSAAEVYRNSKTNVQMALEKIAAGDLDIAGLLREQHREWVPWHDVMCATIGYVFGTCYVERGAHYLDDKLKVAYDTAFEVFYPYYHALDDEQNVRSLCTLHHYHIMTFTLTEEEDRFVFLLDPCGSGGRLYRGEFWRDVFRYGGEISPLMREEHVVNFHRKDFPVYCTHCSSHNRDQFRRDSLWFINDGHMQAQPGMPCVQYYYKKSKGIRTVDVDPRLRSQVDM